MTYIAGRLQINHQNGSSCAKFRSKGTFVSKQRERQESLPIWPTLESAHGSPEVPSEASKCPQWLQLTPSGSSPGGWLNKRGSIQATSRTHSSKCVGVAFTHASTSVRNAIASSVRGKTPEDCHRGRRVCSRREGTDAPGDRAQRNDAPDRRPGVVLARNEPRRRRSASGRIGGGGRSSCTPKGHLRPAPALPGWATATVSNGLSGHEARANVLRRLTSHWRSHF